MSGDGSKVVYHGAFLLAAFLLVLVLATAGDCYVGSVAVLPCFGLQASA